MCINISKTIIKIPGKAQWIVNLNCNKIFEMYYNTLSNNGEFLTVKELWPHDTIAILLWKHTENGRGNAKPDGSLC